MSYVQSDYSIHPTIEELDADMQDMSDSLLVRYAEVLDFTQVGSKSWEVMPLAQRKALRANNELASRQNKKELAEKKAAEEKRIQAQQDAQIEAKIVAFKQQARGAWIGDQASFDAAWPTLLKQWQIDQVNATLDRTKAEVRARMVGF
jgi:hypothetical protein